ncbi:PTS sugar transporter subunit IIA [Liquorilactobacillus satsumensis]|uniref:PTS sugar transporter subunit IIA n=1 Tax=Liquorilactobacillus TaxID=2767888 RepID=UPI001E3FC2CE|nr:fructose PTS transporter subunit IIA [Liquorilactobacillus satsumensis]MCC7667231.1 PTS mannose transporter subunit IIAB [Liquorilactobacillus satsumensis]MCP9328084.1 PTS sugar transporter subunit IIA [Liquorilactobacillus satsumensis]
MESNINNFEIAKVITPELISIDLKAVTKEEAIEELTELLFMHGDVIKRKEFKEDVMQRETEGMTGLGQGVAIPHGKSKAVKNTTLAVGISHHKIAWETLDNEPVTIVILFAVKDTDANTLHIRLLQKVAILLADEAFIAGLHRVRTKEEVLELLSQNPKEE